MTTSFATRPPKTSSAERRPALGTLTPPGAIWDRGTIPRGLIGPSEAQLRALTQIVCHLLVRHYRELIAYGAGWTDPERQQPVGDTGRHEPLRPTRSSTPSSSARSPTSTRCADRPARGAVGGRVRARPRGRHPHQGARLRADRAQAPRRIARWRERAARRRVGVHAADALARARRLNREARRRPSPETTVDLDGHRATSDLEELALDDEPNADAA